MSGEIDAEVLAEMRRAWDRREKVWVIAERFGIRAAEVRRLCEPRLRALAAREAKAREAIARRTASARDAERKASAREKQEATIRRLWTEGATGRSLARRFGILPSKVSAIVADLPRPLRCADPEDAPRLRPVPRRAPVPPEPADLLVADPKPKGSAHGRSVLDEARVIEMRRLRARGWSTGRLAERYGVNRNTVSYALLGRTWAHVAEGLPEGGGRC